MADIIPYDKSEAIEEICLESTSFDADELSCLIMSDPRIRLHGPEHHYITAAAVLAAYCNKCRPQDKYRFLQMARSRTVRIPVGVCALYGTCGAMMGAGAAVSIILTAHPFDADILTAVNSVTASIQNELAEYHGIRCCKRAVRASVRGAVSVLNKVCCSELPLSYRPCFFSALNEGCISADCRYFGE